MPSKPIDAAYDVFIAGAGPAGAALAIALCDAAPDLRICFADAGRDEAFRIGESVPPPIKPFLDHLGLSGAFQRDAHCPAYRTVSVWGGPELISNEFFLQVYNTGWRLDRARFDRMLVLEAERRGADLLTAKVSSLDYDGQTWRVDCGTKATYTARFVVDATGRAAVLSRLLGLKPVKHDKLVAAAVFFEQTGSAGLPWDDAALIESRCEGWWYTVKPPDGRRVAMLMTDADIAHRLQVSKLDDWLALLAETRYVQPLIASGRPLSVPKFWPAASHYCDIALQPGMLAVGDALSSFDPLSSQGIIKALRSSIFASYAIADLLLCGDESGIVRYNALMRREYASYRETWRDYYRQEQRWPDALFWRRRH